MNPVFTVQNENDLDGYWYDEFVKRFDEICQEHLENGRAKKFAFIVYDFLSPTHEVLKNQGVFTELDRISGKDITIFYLDGQLNGGGRNKSQLLNNFNSTILEITGQNISSIPFITFFDFHDNDVSNFKFYRIRNKEKFILNDLTNALKEELNIREKVRDKESSIFSQESSIFSIVKKTIGVTPKIVYTEFIKEILKGMYQ